MNTQEFEQATEKDLRRKANECFDKIKDSGSHEHPALLLQAQFYLAEIERRGHDWVATRDLWLEIVVIVLIGLELYFGITGGNAEIAALQKLTASASQTATAMTTLANDQNATLNAIKQLDERTPEQNRPAAEKQKPRPPKGRAKQ